jgi:UDP-GlcNAc:undecaprenyl-phosphate GlcNAc-1-phosphate transferase
VHGLPLLYAFPAPTGDHSVLETLRDNLQVVYGAALALVVVVLLTPAVGGMARLLGVVDAPGGRRLNRRSVPRLGGVALFLGIFVPSLAFLDVGRETRGLLLGAAVAVTVGAIDDFRGLDWWAKLGGQLLAAAIPVGFGIWVDRFTFPFLGIHALPEWVGAPLTVLWIVAIMNMVNFLDGMDGLAAGVAAIAGGTFCVIALSLGKPEPAVLSAIVFGAALGFLRHNFYPARIFMGDSGALLLGYVLATVSVQGLLKTAATVALFFPLLVLAIPILDTSFVVARRLKHGERVFVGDQAHLHHRFLRRGFTQRTAALYMYAWCLSLAAAALATRFIPFRAHGEWHVGATIAVTAIGLVALGASVYTVYLLEIVKLANPRARRRDQDLRDRKTA